MSAERLQEAIRRAKTPVALVLDPREDRLDKKYLKNFVRRRAKMRENEKVKEKGKKYLLAVVFVLAIVSSIVVTVKLTGGFSTFGLSKTAPKA